MTTEKNGNQKDVVNDKFLNKKTKPDSQEKVIHLIKYGENGKEEIQEIKVKSCQELSNYLSSLKYPFSFKKGKFLDLSTKNGQKAFYYDEELNTIFQREDKSKELLEEYTLLFQEYLEDPDHPKINYPINIERLIIGPKFFFNLSGKKVPKFYGMINRNQLGLTLFFQLNEFQIFHLFTRKGCGTSLYFMKQMHRQKEYYIYYDLRKLKKIMEMNDNELRQKYMKNFILYSLFHIHGYYINIEFGFKRIEEYFDYIWNKIFDDYINRENCRFIICLLNAYISVINEYILSYLNKETEPEYETIVIILDHFQYDFDITLINDITKKNPKIRFVIKYTLNNIKAIENFFNFIDNDNFKLGENYPGRGIEILNEKNRIMIGYYWEMINLSEKIFEDKDLNILNLYKEELIANFGLNNQIYYYKFLDYIDKQAKDKDISIFNRFIKIITNEIELDFNLFYNNDLAEQIYFISKYYNEFLLEEKPHNNKNLIESIKKNIPLDYFIIIFSNTCKDIINIIPSCNLVKNIITKKSKYFDSIIYQSKYYNTSNKSEQGNILQRAVESKLMLEPNILLNYLEKTFIFKIEHIIPSAKFIQNKTKDPVELFFKEQFETRRNKKKNAKIITSYMSKEEIRDMENLAKDVFSKEKMELYKNIILIQTDTLAKNYDLGIIRFLFNKRYALILFQITVSTENKKFGGVNNRFEKDIYYITSKIDYFFPDYKSDGVHLIYVLDKNDESLIPELYNIKNEMFNEIQIQDNNFKNLNMKEIKFSNKMKNQHKEINEKNKNKNLENLNKKGICIDIDYKYNLSSQLYDQVHLIYFSRKFLNFFNEEGEMIKGLNYENNKLSFDVSEIKHYFSHDYLQKIFNKIISVFNIKIGKIYYAEYDYENIPGNYLILTKLDINKYTAIINIDGNIIHFLKIINFTIAEIKDFKQKEKISYFFEIINPKEVNSISLFENIIVED